MSQCQPGNPNSKFYDTTHSANIVPHGIVVLLDLAPHNGHQRRQWTDWLSTWQCEKASGKEFLKHTIQREECVDQCGIAMPFKEESNLGSTVTKNGFNPSLWAKSIVFLLFCFVEIQSQIVRWRKMGMSSFSAI